MTKYKFKGKNGSVSIAQVKDGVELGQAEWKLLVGEYMGAEFIAASELIGSSTQAVTKEPDMLEEIKKLKLEVAAVEDWLGPIKDAAASHGIKLFDADINLIKSTFKATKPEKEVMNSTDQLVELEDPDWDSYVGQLKAKRTVQLKVRAAMERMGIMDHMLIIGESGTGKTTLANLIAQEHGLPFLSIMVTPDFKVNAFNRMVLEFLEIHSDTGGIVFLDEVHNFDKKKQHYFLSVLEGNYLAMDNGKKIFFESPLAIIAATTEEQLLIGPLARRFHQPIRLQAYTDDEMAEITQRLLCQMDLEPTRKESFVLGQASAGSPAQAGSIAKIARDLKTCDPEEVLSTAGITPQGLTVDHIDYLKALRALGGSGGLANINSHAGRSKDVTLKSERLLLRLGFIELNKSGRDLTQLGSKALHLAEEKAKLEESELAESTPFI